MKRILSILLIAGTIISCNNSSDPDRDKNDSLNMHPNGNSDNAADRIPYDKKDTNSYERMSGKTSDSTP